MPDACLVCGNTKAKDHSVSFHRFPKDQERRSKWISSLQLKENVVKDFHRVCSRHFPNGDAINNDLNLTLGKKFASPMKSWSARSKRAKARKIRALLDKLNANKSTSENSSRFSSPSPRLSSPSSLDEPVSSPSMTIPIPAMCSTPAISSDGEQSDISMLDSIMDTSSESTSDIACCSSENAEVIVSTALLARIELLQAENKRLTKAISSQNVKREPLSVKQISCKQELVKLYTGFPSYEVFLAFYEFLGPSVKDLTYWGDKKSKKCRSYHRKIESIDQFLLTLMKLNLNLRNKDLAFRFCISESLVSRYLCTWICFLYQHLKEIDWMPTVDQVAATLPHAFKMKYPLTYAIIDGSEVFIQTPNDLHLQSSTWSNYKHHNTAKFLLACTPNGAICYISPLFVGSISDVELTRVCGFLDKLEGKKGVSIMADRGFTIKDLLYQKGASLNIPPFMDGRQQLPSSDVKFGRSIASLRIHVERAIGRIKQFGVLQGTFPLSMVRLANQIVCICAWLTNFHPVLISQPHDTVEDVDKYFSSLSDSDSECLSDED